MICRFDMTEFILTEDRQIEGGPVFSCQHLKNKHTCELYKWWQQIAIDGPPSWKMFDILEFVHLSNSITVSRRKSSEAFEFVLQGEHTLDILGRERLYKAEIRADHENLYERELYAYYERICQTGEANYFRGPLASLSREYKILEAIDLPFRGKEGDVDTILSLLVEVK